jgi:hypothetical protein
MIDPRNLIDELRPHEVVRLIAKPESYVILLRINGKLKEVTWKIQPGFSAHDVADEIRRQLQAGSVLQ